MIGNSVLLALIVTLIIFSYGIDRVMLGQIDWVRFDYGRFNEVHILCFLTLDT